MLRLSTSGSTVKMEAFLKRMKREEAFKRLDHYGKLGVEALSNATPVDSSLTANSWKYRIIRTRGKYTIEWYNTHIESGANIAILIQYGHGTGTGGWVEGRDYINPAIRPVFDKLADLVWKEVTKNG